MSRLGDVLRREIRACPPTWVGAGRRFRELAELADETTLDRIEISVELRRGDLMIGRAARRWKKIESVKGPEYVASVRSIANVLPKGAAEVLRASYVLRGAITLDGRQARWCLSHDLIKSIADGFGLYMITSKGADVWRAHCEAKR